MTNVEDDTYQLLQDDAAVVLEYKGPDTYDNIQLVQGVHDPALESAAPATAAAAAAALTLAKQVSKEEAVLSEARTKGAELSSSLAHLHAQEKELREKEGLNTLQQGPLTNEALRGEFPLERGLRHGPHVLGQPQTSQQQVKQRAQGAEDHPDGEPSLQHHPEPSLQRRGRASDGRAGVDKDGVQQQHAFKRLQWPSYRDDGKSYTIVGSSIRQTTSSSAHDSERRWGWVKKGLEGYGKREGYGTSERRVHAGGRNLEQRYARVDGAEKERRDNIRVQRSGLVWSGMHRKG